MEYCHKKKTKGSKKYVIAKNFAKYSFVCNENKLCDLYREDRMEELSITVKNLSRALRKFLICVYFSLVSACTCDVE